MTAGNASGQSDGAALGVITHLERAADLGLRPIARLVARASAGVEPARMGLGPVPAVARALHLAGLTWADIDLIELNEAFAAQVVACTQEWRFTTADFERLNVKGSGISLGHPIGATGGRILATLTREMQRRGARYGLETMCIGGGQGIAAATARRLAVDGYAVAVLDLDASAAKERVLSVEDWAEIRRLRRAEQMSISEIVLRVSRNTVPATLSSENAPKYERAAAGSSVDAVEPRIRESLIVVTDQRGRLPAH